MNGSRWSGLLRAAAAVIAAAGLSGCATYSIKEARTEFYRGRAPHAAEKLSDLSVQRKDRPLLLMERGTINQLLGNYESSTRDFLTAEEWLRDFETFSVSRGTGSLVVNDMVQEFVGYPFERTYVHAFAAQSYLALGDWENAAVEARKMIKTLDPINRGKFPKDAYTHYLIGLCFELIDDVSNAALHYRKADELTDIQIDERGNLSPSSQNPASRISHPEGWNHELICIVMSGAALTGDELWSGIGPNGQTAKAEIIIDGKTAGYSRTLTDLHSLARASADRVAAAKLAKTAGRIAVKDAIADGVSDEYPFLGELIRLILIGILEQPDTRRWETLPRFMQVARVPCPPDLNTFTVRFQTPLGATRHTKQIRTPIMPRRNQFISICRDVGYLQTVPEP